MFARKLISKGIRLRLNVCIRILQDICTLLQALQVFWYEAHKTKNSLMFIKTSVQRWVPDQGHSGLNFATCLFIFGKYWLLNLFENIMGEIAEGVARHRQRQQAWMRFKPEVWLCDMISACFFCKTAGPRTLTVYWSTIRKILVPKVLLESCIANDIQRWQVSLCIWSHEYRYRFISVRILSTTRNIYGLHILSGYRNRTAGLLCCLLS